MFGRLSLIALMLSFAAPAMARTPMTCTIPANQAPSLKVHVQTAPPSIDHSYPRSQLKMFDIATISPYGNGANVHVNGLMRGAISFETKSALGWQRSVQADENCFWYSKIELTLKLQPVIYVAAEIPKDTCLYREVLTHEYKHIATDENLIANYQVIFQNEINRFIQSSPVFGPYAGVQKAQVQHEMTKRLEYAIQAVYARMKAERIQRQAGVDTREEYERVARACPGEGQRGY